MDEPHRCASLWKVACKQQIAPSKKTVDSGSWGKLSRAVWRRVKLGQVLITSERGFAITVLQNDDEVLVRLNGRTTVDSSPDLRDRLLEVLSDEPSPRVVTVDLTSVTYIEASGIATLIEARKIARHRQMTFCLQGLGGSVLRLFEVTGVLALFEASNSGQKVS